MAQNTYKQNTPRRPAQKEAPATPQVGAKFEFLKDPRLWLAVGFLLMALAIFLLGAMVSYLFTGSEDQSLLITKEHIAIPEAGKEVQNWLGMAGARAAHFFMYFLFGVSSLLLTPIIFGLGFRLVFKRDLFPFGRLSLFLVFTSIWLSATFGLMVYSTATEASYSYLSGAVGYELAILAHSFLGWGAYLLMIFLLIVFSIFYFNITKMGLAVIEAIEAKESDLAVKDPLAKTEIQDTALNESESTEEEEQDEWIIKDLNQPKDESPIAPISTPHIPDFTVKGMEIDNQSEAELTKIEEDKESENFIVNDPVEENIGTKSVNYDPTLDLPSYQYPPLDLLNEYDSKVQVTKGELEANMENIVKTLSHYNIEIAKIEATIGPTVTLYEIIPAAGVRISKIKGLVDDIALNLAALGIRIIAPMPGKGTIGIEVPNKSREMVSIRSMLSSEKFLKSDKDLPVALGKTISNEVFVADLAKMPHLLMAGATGQGKSVGLNVILTSLIYKKHPSQLKFVLVDPKKVELTLFNQIERHFLAQLPGSPEAIITDTRKVVNTLNSLCIEMDERYDLLKDAQCRSLKEYNTKFVERRLNPQKGHRFLPFIVLVIDELADLMMTAGKEVETPIARLAQLARAIGIHLVVATQRPSVNVITGIIKANFPVRLSFRVSSKIDSRTILDTGGAEQLIGQGDMLLSMGSDLVRIQCAFVDTPEVERVCEYIGQQRGYETAYQLPEYISEDEEGISDFDFSDRDPMFEDAARLIVSHQQGSTSLIQRKLKLGYNRAGRLIDQLEAAGIVGPFEGSKAREVLILDEYSLEQKLNSLKSE